MRVVAGGDRSQQYGGRFTGRAEIEMLAAATANGDPDTALVRFFDGAVSFWHRHPGGQQLFVHAGTARVGTEVDGEVTLQQGSLVVCPPNERHWHGAAAGRDTTLLALTWGVTQWEDVAPPVAPDGPTLAT